MKNNEINLSGYIIYIFSILVLLTSFYFDVDDEKAKEGTQRGTGSGCSRVASRTP